MSADDTYKIVDKHLARLGISGTERAEVRARLVNGRMTAQVFGEKLKGKVSDRCVSAAGDVLATLEWLYSERKVVDGD